MTYIRRMHPMCLFILLYATYGAIDGDVNIALGKPTFQVDVFNIGSGDKAVDGNKNTNYHGASCTETSYLTNPWWAVDLEQSHFVYKVTLTNRGDCCGERLQAVRIGTTDVSPSTSAPALSNYELCASYAGPVAQGASKAFYCSSTGRYLIVQLEGYQRLTLCEVEVFSAYTSMDFEPIDGSRLSGHVTDVYSNVTSRACAYQCMSKLTCSSFNYEEDLRVCELNEATSIQQTNNRGSDTLWTFYALKEI